MVFYWGVTKAEFLANPEECIRNFFADIADGNHRYVGRIKIIGEAPDRSVPMIQRMSSAKAVVLPLFAIRVGRLDFPKPALR